MATILIIARGFPPYISSLGGAMRMLKLAEFLTQRGHDVHVLAGRGREYTDFGYGALLRQLNVHYVDDPALRVASAGVSAERSRRSVRSRLKAAVRPLALDLAVPDTGVIALPRFIAAAQRITRRHNVSTVISSGPPHSDHLIAMALRRRYPQLRWIADYRDSWNGTSLFRKRLPPAQFVNTLLERAVLRRADCVTAISPPMLTKLTRIAGRGFDKTKLRLIMNGFDEAVEVPSEPLGSRLPLRIGYFGAIDDRKDSYRNPALFFDALQRSSADVELEFFGPARFETDWKQRLGPRIMVNGTLPHAEASTRMSEFDVLMLLHTRREGADEVITGKVFEYVRAGRPVLSVGPLDMAVNELLRDDPLFFSVDHEDIEGQIRLLERLASMKENGNIGLRPISEVAKYSRQSQYEKIIPLIS